MRVPDLPQMCANTRQKSARTGWTWTVAVAGLLALAACGDDGTSNDDVGTPDAGTDTATDPDAPPALDTDADAPGIDADNDANDDTDAHEETSPEPPIPDPFPDGTYLLGVSLAPVGGIELEFQIVASDGTLSLSAYDGDTPSDPIAEASDVVVDADGAFFAIFGEATVPGPYSPTSSPVVVDITIEGNFREDGTACGALQGHIITLNLPLDGSTFGMIDWSARADGTLVGCDAREPIERIETCPELEAGVTSDFPSGGMDRLVELVLPVDYDAAESYPLLFAFHGFGGDPASLLDTAGLRAFADELGIIIAAPLGLDTGNGPLWNVTAAPDVNEDIALYDDLLTCISEAYAVDLDRVYATGMSYGGLMTAAVLSERSETIAAAAPFSGGFIRDLSGEAVPRPTIVSWGGEDDEAFDQDFDRFARSMIDDLVEINALVVSCDHGEGHTIRASYWPWALDFLLRQSRTDLDTLADGLPDTYPDYCIIVE